MSTVLFLLSIVRVTGYGGLGLYDARVGALLRITSYNVCYTKLLRIRGTG